MDKQKINNWQEILLDLIENLDLLSPETDDSDLLVSEILKVKNKLKDLEHELWQESMK